MWMQTSRASAPTRISIALSRMWLREAIRHNYAQNFTWSGARSSRCPQDTYAVQELVWAVKPDLIIETGIAHGGSLVLSARCWR